MYKYYWCITSRWGPKGQHSFNMTRQKYRNSALTPLAALENCVALHARKILILNSAVAGVGQQATVKHHFADERRLAITAGRLNGDRSKPPRFQVTHPAEIHDFRPDISTLLSSATLLDASKIPPAPASRPGPESVFRIGLP